MEDEKISTQGSGFRVQGIVYLIAFLITGYCLLATVFYGCAKKDAEKPKEPAAEEAMAPGEGEQAQHKVLSFNLEGLSDRGEKKWEVNGESAEAVSETEIKIKNVVAKSYGEETEATITADKGIYDRSKNNVKLEESVRATIETTPEFAADYADFTDPVSGIAQKKPQPVKKEDKVKTIITCDGNAEFNYEKNIAFFDKNVKVVSDDGSIYADKITINIGSETKKITDIIAEGSVKIVRGEDITYSDRATYVADEKKIVLTGRPKLVIYRESDLSKNLMKE